MSSRFFTNQADQTLLKKFQGVFESNIDIERFDALVGYLPTIWEAAHMAAQRAEEIQIIGNSCPDPDADALRSLFAASTKCRRYVIENPHPEEVYNRLKSLLPATFTGEVICKTERFGATPDPSR